MKMLISQQDGPNEFRPYKCGKQVAYRLVVQAAEQ